MPAVILANIEELTRAEFDWVMFGFRILFGLTFAAHGWAKRFSGGGIEGTAGWFDSIGMRPGKVHANAASTLEMAAGVMLILGLFTTVAAAAIVGIMVVAGWTVHRSNGFFIVSSGWEYTFISALMAVVIAGLGAGSISIDNSLGLLDRSNGWIGVAFAVVVGVAVGVGQLAAFYRPPAPAAD